MESGNGVDVISKDGMRGRAIFDVRDGEQSDEPIVVQLEGGLQVSVPREVLELQDDGSYYLPLDVREWASLHSGNGSRVVVVPVYAEQVHVEKRVATQRVRVTKRVHERRQVVDEPGFEEELEVKRVPVGRFVDAPPATRTEGDTTIVPVLEEVVVVQKRLRVKEEVHITRRRREVHRPAEVTLRSEEAVVEPGNTLPPASHSTASGSAIDES